MCTLRVLAKKDTGTLNGSRKFGDVPQQATKDIVKNVLGARSRSLRGELDIDRELRGVRDGSFENDDKHARPDEPRGDRRLLRVEPVKIRVRLAVLEEELDLPA